MMSTYKFHSKGWITDTENMKQEERLHWPSSWAVHSRVHQHQSPAHDNHFWWMLTAVLPTNITHSCLYMPST